MFSIILGLYAILLAKADSHIYRLSPMRHYTNLDILYMEYNFNLTKQQNCHLKT